MTVESEYGCELSKGGGRISGVGSREGVIGLLGLRLWLRKLYKCVVEITMKAEFKDESGSGKCTGRREGTIASSLYAPGPHSF